LQTGYDTTDAYNYYRFRSGELVTGTNADHPGRWVLRVSRLPGIFKRVLWCALSVSNSAW